MALELVVEDGSIVQGANSYVDLVTARDYAALRGKALPTVDDEAIPIVIAGTEYIESFSRRLRGLPVSPSTQPLSFPRTGVTVDGYTYPDNVIPSPLLKVCLAAIVVAVDHELVVNRSEPDITREQIGPMSTSYGTSSIRPWSGPDFPLLDNLIRPFLGGAGVWQSIPIKKV